MPYIGGWRTSRFQQQVNEWHRLLQQFGILTSCFFPQKVEQTFGLRSRMMALLDGHVPGMKELYNTFRFLLACVIIFGSGYLLAKPHNDADKLFAPLICLIAVYSLWRGRTPTDSSLEP